MCVSTPTMCVCEVWYVSLHPHYVSLHPHYVCREYVLTTDDKPHQHSQHTTHTQHLHTRRWYVSLQPHYMCVRYGMCLSTPPLLSQTQRVPGLRSTPRWCCNMNKAEENLTNLNPKPTNSRPSVS
jgi:hypothetical protein